MDNKLEVRICTGTLCYVMGGADLQLLDEHLSPEILERVEIKGAPCLDCCNTGEKHSAPYVKVGDVLVSEATLEKVAEVIRTKLSEQ